VRYETTMRIEAPARDVWAVLVDIERWPSWTESITRVRRLDSGPLRVGSRARLKQPRFPPMVWEVTELEPARSFCWVARVAGMTTLAEHYLSARPDGSTEALTRIGQDGLLAPLADLIGGRRGRRYVDLEAAGLKRHCEQR
jgi:uncharacterized membrane protein